MKKNPNNLKNETSPYLLQHLYNPVDWYPWNDETLKKAIVENKLLIISIGYAACHWCHVMERESFENDDVANLMNKHFISIKVDREERPDIDQVYMNAVQLISGRGGWPLNVIALPDGKPIYAGTYFPKENWMNLLSQIINLKENAYNKLEEQANEITDGIKKTEVITFNDTTSDFEEKHLDEIFESIIKTVDFENGGFDRAPKFPMPIVHSFLLNYYYKSQNKKALNAVTLTLDKMAAGGIYDQIGGGFARYSVDEKWFAPHFEKMLYDNGQLLSLYSNAYLITKNDNYRKVVSETIEFIRRELTSDEGGFYSALDADSEGVEGKFYLWTFSEISNLLKENSGIYSEYYNIHKYGNWENNTNILHKNKSDEEIASRYQISVDELESIISNCNKILFEKRKERERPLLDDKILTSWNGLLLKGLIDSYKAFNQQNVYDLCLNNANFIVEKLYSPDGSLYRNYKNGRATINAFLDDYALVIDAFINLYQITFDEKWLNISRDLTKFTIEHFFNKENRMFYFTSNLSEKLVARKYEFVDNVIPSSNSIMANNLFILGHFLDNNDYKSISKQMLHNMIPSLNNGGSFLANWANLLLLNCYPLNEIAVTGKDFIANIRKLQNNFLPTSIFAGAESHSELSLLKNRFDNEKTLIHVCQNRTCQLPKENVEEAMKLIL